MEHFYILSIDQSTQGTKALLLNGEGQLIARRDLPHRQLVNSRGWVGHDGEEIGRNVIAAARDVVTDSGIDPGRIAGVAVTNQRESVAVWNRKTGKPVCESIVWQCSRAASICQKIQEEGAYPEIRRRTGLVPSPFFSAGKIRWILDHVPGAREQAQRGELCAGTMDTWTIWQLTGGRVHKTDCSNASRTQLFNIHTMSWDEELCRIFQIPMSILPQTDDCDGDYGCTDLAGLLPHPVPIRCAIGDSHGALFGHGCRSTGGCMAGHGTGTCVMMNAGGTPALSRHGINATVAWRIGGETAYALEGVVNYAGAVVTWMKNDLGLIGSPRETERLAREANPEDCTYLVPAFTGIGAPHWNDQATACFVGMTRLTGRAELVRAGLDCIAYQVADIISMCCLDAGASPQEVRMAGGPAQNDYLMQFQSDILALPAARGTDEELAGIGAGQIAGLALGLYDLSKLDQARQAQYFYPEMAQELRQKKLDGWRRALRLALNS